MDQNPVKFFYDTRLNDIRRNTLQGTIQKYPPTVKMKIIDFKKVPAGISKYVTVPFLEGIPGRERSQNLRHLTYHDVISAWQPPPHLSTPVLLNVNHQANPWHSEIR